MSGVANAGFRVEGFFLKLFDSDYGDVLLKKIAIVAAMLALAYLNRFVLTAGMAAALASASKAFAQAAGGGEMEEPMHPPKYEDLEKAAAHCVATGNDCLRHCLGMYSMKDASMAGCANSAFQLVAACAALQTLAAVNSEHTGHSAKAVAMVCRDCQKECEKFPKAAECKTCGESCKACAAECDKVAA